MYNEDGETCYMLAVPGSGVTVLNLNHEINLFGSCTNVYTTEVLCYPSIQDEPTQLKVEKDDGWGVNLVTGVLVTAVFAGLAVCTGGAAAVILAGAALGSAAVTAGATYSDIKSGHSRSIDEFVFQLANGAAIGATSAALVGEIVMTLPAASVAAGVEASLIAGNTSVFTAVTVPQLATVGGSGVAAANVMIGLNEAFAIGSGTNVMLETVFDGDVAAYDTAAMMMSMLGVGIIQYGISNIALAPNKNKSSKNGVNLETKSESGSGSVIKNIQSKSPQQLIEDGWEDITNPKMAANTNSREFYDPKSGLKIRFDKGVDGANGFEAVDHYHVMNPNYTNKKVDYYLDIDGKPVGKGSKASHIVIKGEE